MNFRRIVKTILYLLLIFVCTILLLTFINGYEKVISDLITIFNYEDYSDKIKQSIPPERFIIIQLFASFIIILIGLSIKFYESIISEMEFYLIDFKKSFCKLLHIHKNEGLILFLPFLAIIFYSIYLPISYDEAWTFINFTARNVLVSLSYYPAPNNHILHSLLTNISYTALSPFPLLSLRLPTIIISVLTILVSVYSLKNHYNVKIAVLITGLFPVFYMGIYYGYMSRGYQLVIFFFILSLHFVFNIIKYQNRNRDWVWFSAFTILGFFTMPSYLYSYIILNAIILAMSLNKSMILKQIKFTFSVISIVFVLYAPVLLISGLDSLVNNKYVAQINRVDVLHNLPDFYMNSLESITGLNINITLFVFIISLFFVFKQKDWFHLKLYLIFFTLPAVLLLIHSVIPFSRTFNYYGFVIAYLTIVSFKKYLPKIKFRIVISSVIFLQCLLIFSFNQKIYTNESYSIEAKKVNANIIKENQLYLVNSNLFDAYLFYGLKERKIEKYYVEYFPSIKMNADTIQNFNYIVIDNFIDKTKDKKLFYSNDYYAIYK